VPLRSRSPLLPVHPLDARGARLCGVSSPEYSDSSIADRRASSDRLSSLADHWLSRFPRDRFSLTTSAPKTFRESDLLATRENPYPYHWRGGGRERAGGGLEGESYRVSGATRTCDSCVRTSGARGETGMIIPVDALAHCHCCTRDGHERRGRVIPCGCTNRLANRRVPSFGTCTRFPARGFSRHGPRERRRLLLVRGSASLKSSIYLPIFITA